MATATSLVNFILQAVAEVAVFEMRENGKNMDREISHVLEALENDSGIPREALNHELEEEMLRLCRKTPVLHIVRGGRQ
jgi:hypothetical protein